MSFDTTAGRWMEQDPAGYIDGPNEYQMEDSNPVGLVDPSGLDPVTVQMEDGPMVQNQYNGDNGPQIGTGFVWSPIGLDPAKTYAQINVTVTTVTDTDTGKSTTTTDVQIDAPVLCKTNGAQTQGLSGNKVTLPKGSYNDNQSYGHVTKNVKNILQKNYVYVVEVKPPAKIPDPENGYKSVTCPDNKTVAATKPPTDGGKISDTSVEYVETVLEYEYTYVYDGPNDDGNIFFHGSPFSKGQPPVAGNAISNTKDPQPNLGTPEITQAFPSK